MKTKMRANIQDKGATRVTDLNIADEVHMPNRAQHILGRLVDTTIVPLLPPKVANLLQCRQQNLWNAYFQEAEGQFEDQWKETIWPLTKDFDFGTVLELSPGGGRNTEKLSTLTSRLIAVDYNRCALEQTRARLGTSCGGCEISYHQNNGRDLQMVPDASVTAIYCWDSAVHFDKSVVLAYIREFARVLKRGGSGFFHHSDLGDRAHKNIKRNPGWRSNVSKELVARACQANGLTVALQQPVPWTADLRSDWKTRIHPFVDCATIFRKDA
jgi:ubiquinone/menaquinone biosynthesis C-methylase UbiE